jgi:drug/metabolite transporter (DMT)-like permease
MTRRQAVGGLVLVCLVWGVTFTVMKQAFDHVSPLLLLGARFTLATAVVAFSLRGTTAAELRGGLILGLLFWTGFAFQTIGLQYTTPSRSAFITILSTPLVPIVHFAVSRTVPRRPTLAAIVVAVAGTYLLTNPGSGGLNRGDVLTLGCAVVFAGQIVAAGHFASRIPIRRLLAIELGSTAILSLVASPLLETPRFDPSAAILLIVLLLAITGLWSFDMQLRAQRLLSPTHTALVFTLEPVFASVTSYLVLGERLTAVQLAGGALILAAISTPAFERQAAAT